jgi:hypothetical protein
MNRLKPKCYNKCNSCFFHFTNGCIAPPGEDYYIEMSEKQAELILKNKNRFHISYQKTKEITQKFPSVAVTEF